MSWIAEFVSAVFEVGAVYATDADLPAPIGVASVSTTEFPSTATPTTESISVPFFTVNAVVGAVVGFNASLYVIVNFVPVASTEAD